MAADEMESPAVALPAALQRELLPLELATAALAREKAAGHCASPDNDLLVIDGVGSHQRGELASKTAVDALRDALRRAASSRSLPGVEDVVHALSTASQAVAELAHGAQSPPGTTVTGLCLVEQEGHARWLIFNIGDSRTYRFGAHGIEQITVDHSLVQEMADIGLPVGGGLAHVITRAIGGGWDQACMPTAGFSPSSTATAFSAAQTA